MTNDQDDRCGPFREAISARLDDEALGMCSAELDRHITRCPSCSGWEETAGHVTRRVRLSVATDPPDVTAAVLAALPVPLPEATRARSGVLGAALRATLFGAGLVQAALSWPALWGVAGVMSAPAHSARETGSWGVAVAIAFLAVAIAPRLAVGALPVLGAFGVLLTVVTLADLGAGRVHVDRAADHLVVLAGVAAVVALAWRGRAPGRGAPWRGVHA